MLRGSTFLCPEKRLSLGVFCAGSGKVWVWCVLCIRDGRTETRSALEVVRRPAFSPPFPLTARGAVGSAVRLRLAAVEGCFYRAEWYIADVKRRAEPQLAN